MASIFKRPSSPYWFAAYRAADGSRAKKSTKSKDKATARRMALEFETLAQKGRAGFLTEAAARKVVSELVMQATGEALHFATCKSWLAEWLAGKKGTTADSTWKKYDQTITDFLEHLGQKASSPLAAISPGDVRSFRDALSSGGRAPSTVNNAIRKTLSVPFAAALRIGYITINPCASVPNLRDDEKQSRETFTAEQMRRLLASAQDDWKGAILMGYFSGLRLRDISDMLWESIDLDRNVIVTKTRKNRAQILIPMHSDLSDWLRAQTRGIAKAPVFPSLFGKGTGGRHGLSGRFNAIMEAAGIKGAVSRTRAEGSAGRTTTTLSFHALRHSMNSALANAGVSQEIRQKLTGHADAKSNTIYTHMDVANLRAAVNKVASLGCSI